MKKSVFNFFEKNKKNTSDAPTRSQTKKIVLNTASYSDFKYRQATPSTPVRRIRQTPEKREIVRTSKLSQKRLGIIVAAAVAAVAITVPVYFATAANSNEVAKIAEINLSSPSPSIALQAAVAAPTPTATDGQLTGNLTETLTKAAPVPQAATSSLKPAAQTSPAATTSASPAAPAASAAPGASASPAPAASVESAFSEMSFKQGTNDPFISNIQQRLMDLDYMENDETTTLLGPTTSAAIECFQRKNNIPVDGNADPKTMEVLFSNSALHYTVSLNDDGPDVESVQDRLRELGYDVNTTGHFGTDTQKAVVKFQQRNNISDDGSIGAETKELLYSSKAKGPKSSGSSGSSGHSGNPTHIANPGSVEAFIKCAMNQLGVPYVLGGKSNKSLDCSGLVYYALKLSGNGIGYMTSGGWAGADEYPRINSMSGLKRGDIVCVRGHVGIYLGDGTVINASSSHGSVCISGDIFSSDYWTSNWICGRRPL